MTYVAIQNIHYPLETECKLLVHKMFSRCTRRIPNVCRTFNSRPRHCVKRVRIRSFSGPHFPAFGLHTDTKDSGYGRFSRSGVQGAVYIFMRSFLSHIYIECVNFKKLHFYDLLLHRLLNVRKRWFEQGDLFFIF